MASVIYVYVHICCSNWVLKIRRIFFRLSHTQCETFSCIGLLVAFCRIRVFIVFILIKLIFSPFQYSSILAKTVEKVITLSTTTRWENKKRKQRKYVNNEFSIHIQYLAFVSNNSFVHARPKTVIFAQTLTQIAPKMKGQSTVAVVYLILACIGSDGSVIIDSMSQDRSIAMGKRLQYTEIKKLLFGSPTSSASLLGLKISI